MPARHTAYGLDLHASFPLLGMRSESRDGLPRLALELLAPAELEQRFSGADGPPEWRGRLGDGRILAIERGIGGDVLFTYGDRARFRLDASLEHLECAPLCEGLHWHQALLGRVLPNVAIMRGYEALHASAVDSPEGVVAIAAASGMGKTTLALELQGRGWPLVADDVLALGEGPEGVLAHPGTPHMNVAEEPSGAIDPELLGDTLGTLAGERWIAAHATATGPRPVRLVCLLERGPDLTLEGQILPPNPLPLAPYMLGLGGDAERERRRFTRYADLMSTTTLMRLTCGNGDRPTQLAEQIEQTLAEQSLLVAGSAR
ncbi:MAG TPA: hypothetical protein VG147_00330 [Solirubrobacteraceae bacterium]|jgi:hypothetical protein|nr:hypothetical protein [Solirubrobacteraceae bacterium]